MTGFRGLCVLTALYVGRAMDRSLDAVWVMFSPWMYSSRGTGRTLGWKLKVQLALQPNQLATSFALAMDAPSAKILIGFSS